MDKVTLQELRNNGGEVLDRVTRGEYLIVTRGGISVAELTPLRRSSAPPAELIARRRLLPQIDLKAFQKDIDGVVDASV